MTQAEPFHDFAGGKTKPANPTEHGILIKVGTDVYPVYGNDELGWSLEGGGLQSAAAAEFRYPSLEELFFVLVNFSVTPDGHA